jgi:hypothetical protein
MLAAMKLWTVRAVYRCTREWHLGKMNASNLLLLAVIAALCVGCYKQPQLTGMAAPAYLARPEISTSLFPSDQAVLGDEAVARILSSKVVLPAKAKLALMSFPIVEEWRRRAYWRDEEHWRLLESQVEILSKTLLASDQVSESIPLPLLMTPDKVSIPVLREAAVRLQADLLLVFRAGGDAYTRSRLFAKDKVKAFSTCELVLLDVRTGLVPFTRVVSRERMEEKQASDFDLSETTRRAEQLVAADALQAAAEELVVFLKSVPRKGE